MRIEGRGRGKHLKFPEIFHISLEGYPIVGRGIDRAGRAMQKYHVYVVEISYDTYSSTEQEKIQHTGHVVVAIHARGALDCRTRHDVTWMVLHGVASRHDAPKKTT